MSTLKKGLGRGLDALISSENNIQTGVLDLKIHEIETNTNQPRKKFDDEKLLQLAESIKQHGVIQPVIVKKESNGVYRIIAGERRWRAARMAGFTTIPVIVKELSDRQSMEVALIENLQREDLNPIEEAEAYDRLMKEHNLTQEELSVSVGKSRPSVANSVRLLELSDSIKEYVINGDLSSGHARTILPIEDKELQQSVAQEVIKNNLSVRETERLVKKHLTPKKEQLLKQNNEQYLEIQDRLQYVFGTKVKLLSNKKNGKILIEYYSPGELDRILELVNSIPREQLVDINKTENPLHESKYQQQLS
jgi:ParB family transcriptional regulator, chromosome partitioning protein